MTSCGRSSSWATWSSQVTFLLYVCECLDVVYTTPRVRGCIVMSAHTLNHACMHVYVPPQIHSRRRARHRARSVPRLHRAVHRRRSPGTTNEVTYMYKITHTTRSPFFLPICLFFFKNTYIYSPSRQTNFLQHHNRTSRTACSSSYKVSATSFWPS